MPRSRRIGKARVQDWQKFRVMLTTGYDFFGDCGTDHPPQAKLKQAWAVLRESILTEFAADPRRRAGKRPWAFWVLDLGMDGRPSDEEQLQYLTTHALLTEAERRVLAERVARSERR